MNPADLEEIKEGDWVEMPGGYIGRVISVWPPYAKVLVRIGGSQTMEAYRLEELKRC